MTTTTDFLPETQETETPDVEELVDQALSDDASQSDDAGAAAPAPEQPGPAPQPVISQEQYAALAQQNAQMRQLLEQQAMLAQAQQTLDKEEDVPELVSLEQYTAFLDQVLPQQYSDPQELQAARDAFITQHETKLRAAAADATRNDVAAMRQELAELRHHQLNGGNQGWAPEQQFATLNMASTMASMIGQSFDPTYVMQGLQSNTLDPETRKMVSEIMEGVTVNHDIASAQPIIRNNILKRAGQPVQNGQAANPQTETAPAMPPTPQSGGAAAQGRRFNNLEEVTEEYLRDGTAMTTAEFDSYVAQFS